MPRRRRGSKEFTISERFSPPDSPQKARPSMAPRGRTGERRTGMHMAMNCAAPLRGRCAGGLLNRSAPERDGGPGRQSMVVSFIQRLLFTFTLTGKLPTGEAFRANAPGVLWYFLAREKVQIRFLYRVFTSEKRMPFSEVRKGYSSFSNLRKKQRGSEGVSEFPSSPATPSELPPSPHGTER